MVKSKATSAGEGVHANGERTSRTDDLRIENVVPLPPPEHLIRFFPIAGTPVEQQISTTRDHVRRIMRREDDRLLVIMGPCSIHDPLAAVEYARKLKVERDRFAGTLEIVMRVYFEKPRTTVGWKGLINDPHMNGTHDIVHGLKLARSILLQVNALGLPCATEFLDPIVPQYASDLVAWTAIGARTTESQTHRQMASGLSMPVGFKNATDGALQIALDAMVSARAQHAFVGIDLDGRTSVVKTAGNPQVHLVLRGGGGKANYSKPDIAYTKALMDVKGGERLIMIDCSHGNSNKNYQNQPRVFDEVLQQFDGGEKAILGLMVESNLVAGKQELGKGPLTYGQSVTDGCIDWTTTETLLLEAFKKL